jgi:uncharacterized membrane protein
VKRLFSPWWLLLLAVAGAAALALAYVGIWSPPFHAHAEELGQMGDFFGGLLNPLVSLLTLFVAISVWQLQREELKLTRDELEQTKRAMKDQAKTAEQQRQEQRFFDLLNVYFRTLDGVSFRHRFYELEKLKSQEYKGKAAMAAWLNASPTLFRFALNKDIHGEICEPVGDEIQDVNAMHEEWGENQANEHFGSYFRIVRHLLAEAQNLLGEQHHRYVALFCAQLSRTEIVLLALHLWLDPGGQAAQHLAGNYGLLTNLPKGDLRTELEGEFPPELFTQPRVGAPEPKDFEAEDGH